MRLRPQRVLDVSRSLRHVQPRHQSRRRHRRRHRLGANGSLEALEALEVLEALEALEAIEATGAGRCLGHLHRRSVRLRRR
jgi:hypothetical protein